MSTLYITEYNSTKGILPAEPEVTSQTVTVSGTTAQSAAFNTATNLVRITCDGICSVLFGTNPTATTAKRRMIAGQSEYFSVPQGQSYKVAAITNT